MELLQGTCAMNVMLATQTKTGSLLNIKWMQYAGRKHNSSPNVHDNALIYTAHSKYADKSLFGVLSHQRITAPPADLKTKLYFPTQYLHDAG